MKRKVTKIIATILTITALVILLTACGNKMWFSDSVKNEIYCALVKEADGSVYLHEINKWADSDSDSAMFTTKCCNNYIWTSSNNATFYKNVPEHLDDSCYIICE